MNSLRRALLLALVALYWFGMGNLLAYADNGEASADKQIDKRDALTWLKSIQAAAQKLAYSGTFIYQQANQVRMSRITHVLDGKNELEKLEILDGKPREYIRNNEDIACYIPESKIVQTGKRFTPEFFPGMLAANVTELAEHYDVSKGVNSRVAGYDCQAIDLAPKDNLRYGYRLCVDKNSGLLLRAQIVNEHHDVVEQISFAQLGIGGIDKSSVRPSFPNTAIWHVENVASSPMIISGWSVKAVPPGFKKIHESRRMVFNRQAFNAEPGSAPAQVGHEVSHLVFSDGLAAISVFVEPETQNRVEGYMQQGAMNIVGKRQGDFWLTIVGEVPATAIKQVANSIEFNPK